jgi:hypothetical protein
MANLPTNIQGLSIRVNPARKKQIGQGWNACRPISFIGCRRRPHDKGVKRL